jgi:RNA polymerase sigma factor (sigma-70 family)
MNAPPSDRELLRRLRADPAALEEFYLRHFDRLVGFVARRVREPAEAADVVASTWLTVLTSAPTYDSDRGEPVAWLLGIAARLIANGHRRRGRERSATGRIAGRRLLTSDDIERLEERIDASRTSGLALQALATLRPSAREALLLVGQDGLAPSEAAQVVGVNAAAFRMRLTSARRALRRSMADVSSVRTQEPGGGADPRASGERAIHAPPRPLPVPPSAPSSAAATPQSDPRPLREISL